MLSMMGSDRSYKEFNDFVGFERDALKQLRKREEAFAEARRCLEYWATTSGTTGQPPEFADFARMLDKESADIKKSYTGFCKHNERFLDMLTDCTRLTKDRKNILVQKDKSERKAEGVSRKKDAKEQERAKQEKLTKLVEDEARLKEHGAELEQKSTSISKDLCRRLVEAYMMFYSSLRDVLDLELNKTRSITKSMQRSVADEIVGVQEPTLGEETGKEKEADWAYGQASPAVASQSQPQSGTHKEEPIVMGIVEPETRHTRDTSQKHEEQHPLDTTIQEQIDTSSVIRPSSMAKDVKGHPHVKTQHDEGSVTRTAQA